MMACGIHRRMILNTASLVLKLSKNSRASECRLTPVLSMFYYYIVAIIFFSPAGEDM